MKLIIINGVNPGKEFIIQEGNNLIGRWDTQESSFPEIDLDPEDADAKISRKHCIIDCTNGVVTIEDIASLNGTFVNQTHKLKEGEQYQLKIGDEILIGKVLVRLAE